MFRKQSRQWKKITISCYAGIILMMALLAFYNNQSFRSLIEKEYWADHSHQVIRTGKEILLALESAETSQIGFIISGDSSYLKSYKTSLDLAFFYQDQLKELTLDNPLQKEQTENLENLIKTKTELLNVTLLWKNKGEQAKIEQYFTARKGKRRMENVRTQLEKIDQTEKKLLAKRNNELKASFLWMEWALHALILITILISFLLYFLFRQQIRLKKAYEGELLQKNNHLSNVNKQLHSSGEKVKDRNEKLLAMNQELIVSKGLLTELNSSLEERVLQRTRELSKVNSENLLLWEQEKLNRMHLEFITNFIPEIVWQTQPDGNHDFFNDRWYEFTGLTPEESFQRAWVSVLHPDDYENNLATWQNSIANGNPYSSECRLRKADGSYRWFISRALPFTSKNGEIIRWIGTCTDVHDFKLQEQNLENQNKRLSEINQYMDNFVHATAHDLRTPVVNMQGLVQLLNHSPGLDENKRKILMQLLDQSVNRLDNTLKSLIKLIELQSYEASPKEKVSIGELWDTVMKEQQQLLDKTAYTIQTNINACSEVTAVKPYLESILRNLLSNALKYKKETEILKISLSCHKEGAFVLLKFQDNGIGIDMEKHGKNIFKPFARFTNQASGSGIGLHMISNMLHRMDGRIEVESTLQKGTTFSIYFKEAVNEKESSYLIKKAS